MFLPLLSSKDLLRSPERSFHNGLFQHAVLLMMVALPYGTCVPVCFFLKSQNTVFSACLRRSEDPLCKREGCIGYKRLGLGFLANENSLGITAFQSKCSCPISEWLSVLSACHVPPTFPAETCLDFKREASASVCSSVHVSFEKVAWPERKVHAGVFLCEVNNTLGPALCFQ